MKIEKKKKKETWKSNWQQKEKGIDANVGALKLIKKKMENEYEEEWTTLERKKKERAKGGNEHWQERMCFKWDLMNGLVHWWNSEFTGD